ncbi:MAG: hypothetical protein HY905_22100 [Deltaproteobacteria bacterium]|nr:hypothetical protein [Deltaproteobacteria bacterium]
MNVNKLLLGFLSVVMALALASTACKKKGEPGSTAQAQPGSGETGAVALAGVADAWYRCPMEQCGYAQKGPGQCPKCGMNLEPAPEGWSPESAKVEAPASDAGAAPPLVVAAGDPPAGPAAPACAEGGACRCPGEGAAEPGVQTAKDLAADRIGQQATCPVTGETFTVMENTPAAKVGDQVYLFCCAGCAPRFLANPQQYGAPAAPAPAAGGPEIKTAGELAPERVGQTETCEIGGDSYTVTAETPAIAYEGKVHLFGCMGCANAFAANPAAPQAPNCAHHGAP